MQNTDKAQNARIYQYYILTNGTRAILTMYL